MDPLSFFLQPLGEYLVQQVATLIKDNCLTVLNVNENLQQLSDTMDEMQGILKEAEGKSMKTKHGTILLNNLKEAFYDSEDLLADCLLAAQQLSKSSGVDRGISEVRLQSSSTFLYPKEFYLRHKFGWKVKRMASKIQKVFDKIKDDNLRATSLQQFQLQPQGICPATEDTVGMMFGRSSSIVGINENESRLVELLAKGSSSSDGVVAVYAVTGMPGIGKTTLARKVLNNDQVKSQFDVNEWVCVSRNYDGIELLRQVIRQISGIPSIDAKTREELNCVFCNHVKNKRVLLVLDDVWKADAWVEFLKNPLSMAGNGSAVLITSRDRTVAEKTKATEIMVDPLSEDDGWSLLSKVAFTEEDGKEDILSFKAIGLEIVKKCKGVPLSIKAIGGILKNKRDITQWQNVSTNKIWNSNQLPEERKSLLLSYLDLGNQLKLCFTFCSLFPEDFKFHHQNLVQLWVAEGFVIASSEDKIEEDGDRYYKELISRNLLQEAPEYFEGKGCMMHDLMRELGQFVVSMRADRPNARSMENRHLYYVQKDLTEFPIIQVKPESLRTLMLSRNPAMKTINGFLLKKFLHLRVLDLSYTGIESLPNSLGKLVHLRHLNVSFSRLKALPSSIGKLSNLQSLLVNGSKHLTLPSEVVQLQNLRHLNLGSGHGQLVCMPTDIGKLLQLRTLQGFAVKDSGSNIKELGILSKLTNLSLYQLEKIERKETAEEADLKNKNMLTYLKLSCTPITDADAEAIDMEKINNIGLVFEGLHLPRSLEAIHIEGFFGQKLPTWINESYLPRLKWLRLEDCKLFLQLPPLGQLQKLKVLDVRGAVAVRNIGLEFFGNATFPKLEELYLIRLAEFSEWSDLREGALPCLKKLHIMKCPKLKYLPDGLSHVRSLEELVVEGLTSLRAIKKLPGVLELRITKNLKLKRLINLPLLKLMHVRRCPSLVEIENLHELKHLVFIDFKMEALPEWLINMTKLQRLDVKGNNTLVTRCYKDKEDWRKIKHIQRVEVRVDSENIKAETGIVSETTHEKNLYISYTKVPYSFDSNYGANI